MPNLVNKAHITTTLGATIITIMVLVVTITTADGDPIMTMDGETPTTTTTVDGEMTTVGETPTTITTAEGDPIMTTVGGTLTKTTITIVDGETIIQYQLLHSRWEISRS